MSKVLQALKIEEFFNLLHPQKNCSVFRNSTAMLEAQKFHKRNLFFFNNRNLYYNSSSAS